MTEATSDAWTQIRYDHEHTNRPVEDICAEHGISSGTLRDRGEVAQPTRVPAFASLTPTPTLALSGDGSPAAPPHAATGAGTREPVDSDSASIAPRLQSAVARVLPAIEATIARLAAGPRHPCEMEQAARALGTLTRTLRELNALLSQHPARAAADDDDDMPEDIDAFRNEIARRINAFVASRSGEANRGEAAETAPRPGAG